MDATALECARRLVEQAHEDRGLNRSGAERVHAYALSRELHGQLAAHREHCALGRGVRDLRGGCSHIASNEATLITDPPPRPTGEGSRLAAEEDAAEVDDLDVIHAWCSVTRIGRRRGHDPRVVVEDVDASTARGDGLVERLNAVRVRDLDRLEERDPHSGGCCSPASADTSATTRSRLPVKTSQACGRYRPLVPVITHTSPSSGRHGSGRPEPRLDELLEEAQVVALLRVPEDADRERRLGSSIASTVSSSAFAVAEAAAERRSPDDGATSSSYGRRSRREARARHRARPGARRTCPAPPCGRRGRRDRGRAARGRRRARR